MKNEAWICFLWLLNEKGIWKYIFMYIYLLTHMKDNGFMLN